MGWIRRELANDLFWRRPDWQVDVEEAILSYALGCNCLQFPHKLPHIQRARIP